MPNAAFLDALPPTVEEFLVLKLGALRHLVKVLDLGGGLDRFRADPETNVPPEFFLNLFLLLRDPNTRPVQRAAAGLILDMYVSNWKTVVPHVVGAVVSRNSIEVRAWRKAVLTRDQAACRQCGETKGLHVHHRVPWSEEPYLRIAEENGITLCQHCHQSVHSGGPLEKLYGSTTVTEK